MLQFLKLTKLYTLKENENIHVALYSATSSGHKLTSR